MANTVTRQVLVNGSRNYVVKFTITGDGSGDETGVRINAVSGDMGTDNKIMKVMAGFDNFSGSILFDATTDVLAMVIPPNTFLKHDYKHFGGIINNAGAGKTGDILLSTNGLGANEHGYIVVEVKKKYVQNIP